jgi:hypothetical protein
MQHTPTTEETMQTQDTKAAFDAMREALEEMVGYAIYGFDGLHDKSVTRAVERAQAALALAKREH